MEPNCTISSENNCCPENYVFDGFNCASGRFVPDDLEGYIYDDAFYSTSFCTQRPTIERFSNNVKYESSVEDVLLSLHPNPASSYIKVTLRLCSYRDSTDFSIDVYDSFGILKKNLFVSEKIDKMDSMVLDVSGLLPGVYYVLLSTKGIRASARFVKI